MQLRVIRIILYAKFWFLNTSLVFSYFYWCYFFGMHLNRCCGVFSLIYLKNICGFFEREETKICIFYCLLFGEVSNEDANYFVLRINRGSQYVQRIFQKWAFYIQSENIRPIRYLFILVLIFIFSVHKLVLRLA